MIFSQGQARRDMVKANGQVRSAVSVFDPQTFFTCFRQMIYPISKKLVLIQR